MHRYFVAISSLSARERIESHVTGDKKQEKHDDEQKSVLKSKRSLTVSSDSQETPSRARLTTTVEPKPTPTKVRRATTDGPSSSKVGLPFS